MLVINVVDVKINKVLPAYARRHSIAARHLGGNLSSECALLDVKLRYRIIIKEKARVPSSPYTKYLSS